MKPSPVVMDTNVLVAGLLSSRGASHALLRAVGQGHFELLISVPLVVEYESIALRECAGKGPLRREDVEAVVDYLCRVARPVKIHYLWRPFLRDPKDDMVLELAVAAQCDTIVTFNHKDFRGSERFGVRTLSPGPYLSELGVRP